MPPALAEQLANDRDRDQIKALYRVGWHVYPITNRDMRDIPDLIVDLGDALRRQEPQLSRA